MASNKGTVIKEGRVVEALPSATFRIQIDGEEREIVGHLSGKMRINHIRVLPGDRVKFIITPYDEGRGRIVYKLR